MKISQTEILEKISFAINQIPINNCDNSANEDAIKAVRFLQEVSHALSEKLPIDKKMANWVKTEMLNRLTIYDCNIDIRDWDIEYIIAGILQANGKYAVQEKKEK